MNHDDRHGAVPKSAFLRRAHVLSSSGSRAGGSEEDHTPIPRAKAPTLAVADAERVARDLFGLDGPAKPLPSYVDQNFRVDGEWVLKIANSDEDEASLDLQNQAMEVVSSAEPDLAPSIRESVNGRSTERVDIDGEVHLVRMVSFLPGRLLAGAADVTSTTWEHLGECLARMDRALAGLTHPAMKRRLLWDLANAGWMVGSVEALPGAAARRLVERIEVQFLADVIRNLDRLPHSIIHNDANDHNIVVAAGDDGARIDGFFDFGDVVWTARVFEPAVACAYAVLGRDDPLAVMTRLVAGYHRELPLDDFELRALFPAACMRLVASVTMSSQSARLDPDNDYIRVSEGPARRALELLSAIEPTEALAALRAACGLRAADSDRSATVTRSRR